MISTPASRICGPPMPNNCTSARLLSAVASRAAYISPEASPAERSMGMGAMKVRELLGCGQRRGKRRRIRQAPATVGVGQFLFLVLQLVEPVVNSAFRQQFLVRALFPQAAFVKYQNAVGVLNGAQAVRDHQRGSAGKQPVERLANQQFRFR